MRHIFSIFIVLLATINLWAITATEAFTSAPESVFPLLEKNTRLDMVDYFNSGMSTSSQNKLAGQSRIISIGDNDLQFTMSSSSQYQIAILPMGDKQIIALIETISTPAPDSNISFYTADWQKYTENVHEQSGVKQWLTAEGRDNEAMVESIVPFMLSSMKYNPENQTLTLSNNVKQFLGADMYSMIESYIKSTRLFTWNGKRFVEQK